MIPLPLVHACGGNQPQKLNVTKVDIIHAEVSDRMPYSYHTHSCQSIEPNAPYGSYRMYIGVKKGDVFISYPDRSKTGVPIRNSGNGMGGG